MSRYVALRRLAEFNPPVPQKIRLEPEENARLLPMDAIQHFDEPHEGEVRPIGRLLQGYAYMEPVDVGYAKVTPCFENGKGLIGSDLDGFSFTSSEMTVLRPGPQLDQKYFSYVVRSEYFRGHAIASMTGAGGLKRVDEQDMRALKIWLPPLTHQRAIADFLDHETAEIDEFLADIQRACCLVEERRSAVTDRELSPSTEKMIPLRRLKPVQLSGVSVNGAPWPAAVGEPGVLKTGAVSKGRFDPAENKAVVDRRELGRLTTAVRADRVLVNRANTPDLVGSAVYVSTSCPELYLSDKIWSLDFDANNAFVAMLLSTRHYREQVRQMAVGASSSMQNLSYADFLKIKVYAPERKAQAELVEKISAEFSLEFELLEQLTMAETLARERRAALISAAVTGQIDVTEKRKPVAEVLEDEVGVRV